MVQTCNDGNVKTKIERRNILNVDYEHDMVANLKLMTILSCTRSEMKEEMGKIFT